ncbi:MAG TPA: 4-hydroxy-3-methylbut-2-enyl diphosphate reductase [Geminicoccus sp.]|jgi:4-hydroxy-3-methylbut-2-enyl diphosphate reductase|uniref:4-hydroxy-3-methylbut-2-enyl diphosphate reductase n=1 Tax=Geminicoccus sp. TaxID=2024832 RepID=UPI002E31C804|nr:4-hydroxy-3-methylbut-2-enyl diphosphate reductase [Geminicoccus sp.]HEX2528891.1 4-hydroxy-3-methylbut-2-enyl diphosphate reductase [Geminicoccus sp.]
MSKPALDVLLARTRGFCAGVERAIDAVGHTLDRSGGSPVYVRHAIVHNQRVVDGLAARGARFVEDLRDVPKGGTVVFSAHGVPRQVEEEARARRLRVVDATCPLVRRVHHEAARQTAQGRTLIVIGHPEHVEVMGIVGRCDGPVVVVADAAEAERLEPEQASNLAYVVQTTLSVDDARRIIDVLTRRFPTITGPDIRTICYATQNRQNAVALLSRRVRRVIVCGDRASSNSNRLRELAQAANCQALLIGDAAELSRGFLEGEQAIGLTAGASVPESIVQETIARIGLWYHVTLREIGEQERSPRLHPVDFAGLDDPAPA